jgi:hypothetical protein
MHSTEQRRIAIETLIRFNHSYADTIAVLGYPNRHTLNNWWSKYVTTDEVPIAKIIRESRFSEEQKRGGRTLPEPCSTSESLVA